MEQKSEGRKQKRLGVKEVPHGRGWGSPRHDLSLQGFSVDPKAALALKDTQRSQGAAPFRVSRIESFLSLKLQGKSPVREFFIFGEFSRPYQAPKKRSYMKDLIKKRVGLLSSSEEIKDSAVSCSSNMASYK